MERRNMPLSDPHHSTVDLLSWSEIRRPDNSSAAYLSNQSDDIGEVLGGGGKTTNEEAESLNKNISYKKNCSGHKLKEMTGSDIFSDNGNVTNGDPNHTSRIHYHQDQDSQISFSGEENATPKKPITLTEAAKQKELSRPVQTPADSKSKKKQISNSKTKAISGGHDIFASPPPESQPRRLSAVTQPEVKGNKKMEESAPRSLRTSAKASNGQSGNRLFSEDQIGKSSRKIHNHKFQQLTSNGLFNSDKIPPGYSERMHSSAKLREMSGHNIFADGKSEYRDYYGGARRPPGGESSISLV